MEVVAEGIETHGDLAVVRASGCDRAQGFLLGEPQPVAAAVPDAGDSARVANRERRRRARPVGHARSQVIL